MPKGYSADEREELVIMVCMELAKGRALSEICREPGMPSKEALSQWRKADERLDGLVRSAREDGVDKLAYDALLIADGALPTALTVQDVQRDRLRTDVRLKVAAKLDPTRWGDTQQLRLADHKGDAIDGGAIAEVMAMLTGRPMRSVTLDAQAKALEAPKP